MEKVFCERLKELRIENNLSQKDLAKRIDVSDGTICFWENGTNEPKLSYIKKLAIFFDVTTDYLIGLENENGSRTTNEEIEYHQSFKVKRSRN